MDLLLWRHAEAEEGESGDDLKRRLTERGEKQAKLMAHWIRAHQPKDMRIIVSPAVRTQQTAEALKLPFETQRKIGPDACVSELIAASGWPAASGAVLIVGHQPFLSEWTNHLTGVNLNFRKSAAAALRYEPGRANPGEESLSELLWYIQPNFSKVAAKMEENN